ncbi:hypothetical protein [Deinococcus ruber]|nr:hypothetical protein [Deinococcus ruber]
MNRHRSLALLIFSLSTASVAAAVATQTLSSPDHSYSITTPGGWTLRPTILGADLIINVPGSAGSINLITCVGQALPQGMNLGGYVKATLDALPGMMDNVKVTGQNAVTVAGLPARELLFTGTNRSAHRPVYGQVILIVRGTRGYTLSYLGETPRSNEASAAVRKSLVSIQFAR